MTLISKERIQEFHELEGDGLDPYLLVEAAFLAHELLDVAVEVKALKEYIEDFGRLGGGAMKEKYGDNPFDGYNSVVKPFKQVSKQARAAIAKATASEGAV